jgi:hypothetical protein
MDIHMLTAEQLMRAASIKEQIDRLNGELDRLLNESNSNNDVGRRRMTPAARRRITEAQRARWAKTRKKTANKPIKKEAGKKTQMSAGARAKVAARMRAYWKAKKAGKKTVRSTQ